MTAVKAGHGVTGIPSVDPENIAALNAFLVLNHGKCIIPVWDDDDEFEEIFDTYTFITTEDARRSIYLTNVLSRGEEE
jgi:hypothetical protein